MLLLLSFALISTVVPAEKRPPPGSVQVITVSSAITGGTTRYIRSALDQATLSGAECLIIQLDTPGGLLSSTRDIVQAILNTKVPVVVYISPQGARGASAGTMITLASHVAAMAPATHIGAAHPVSLFGGNDNKIMNEKVLNDTSAYIESIAQLRGRNVEWAIAAVRESKAITADRAKDLGVIEIIADDLNDLVRQLDGRHIRMDKSTTITLATIGKPLIDLDMTFSQSFLTTLSNPNLVFFLLALGVLGLYIEFSNPGLILPGVAGAISLILALIAMQMLPISYGALSMILLGVALLVAESFVPSFGILGFGGVASMLFGSLFLLDETQTDLQISRPMVFITVAIIPVT
ncbi:MAG: nodulation protein NfeD, partial [SAR324 cluster bacterium]|nr:nodulation protein NfeD [SAR324 cluster bacterium]